MSVSLSEALLPRGWKQKIKKKKRSWNRVKSTIFYGTPQKEKQKC